MYGRNALRPDLPPVFHFVTNILSVSQRPVSKRILTTEYYYNGPGAGTTNGAKND